MAKKKNAFFDSSATKYTEDDLNGLFAMQDEAKQKQKEETVKTQTDFNQGLKNKALPALSDASKKKLNASQTGVKPVEKQTTPQNNNVVKTNNNIIDANGRKKPSKTEMPRMTDKIGLTTGNNSGGNGRSRGPETIDDKINKWSDPNYKMTKDERKEARRLVDNYEKGTLGGNIGRIEDIKNQNYDRDKKVSIIDSKSSGVKAFESGLVDAFGAGLIAKALGNKELADEFKQNISNQNKIAYGGGKLAGKVAQYISLGQLLSPLVGAGEATAGLGEVAADNVASRLLANNVADMALMTVPTLAEAYLDGKRGSDLVKVGADDIATNAMFNTGFDALGEAFKFGKDLKNSKKAAMDTLDEVTETARAMDTINAEQGEIDDLTETMLRNGENNGGLLSDEEIARLEEGLRRSEEEYQNLDPIRNTDVPAAEKPNLFTNNVPDDVQAGINDVLSRSNMTESQKNGIATAVNRYYETGELFNLSSAEKLAGKNGDSETLTYINDLITKQIDDVNSPYGKLSQGPSPFDAPKVDNPVPGNVADNVDNTVRNATDEMDAVTERLNTFREKNKMKGVAKSYANKDTLKSLKFSNAEDKAALNKALERFYAATDSLDNISSKAEREAVKKELNASLVEIDNALSKAYIPDKSAQEVYRQQRKTLINAFKGRKILVSPEIRADLANYPTITSMNNAFGERVFSTKEGVPIGTLWENIDSLTDGMIRPSDIEGSDADIINGLLEMSERLKESAANGVKNESGLTRWDIFNNDLKYEIQEVMDNYSSIFEDQANIEARRLEAAADDFRNLAGNETPKPASRVVAEDIGLDNAERSADDVFASTEEEMLPSSGNDAWDDLLAEAESSGTPGARPDVNAEPPVNREDYMDAMRERYYDEESLANEVQKVSKSVTNSGTRIDPERAAEEYTKGLGNYLEMSEKESFTRASQELASDYQGKLNKYINNEGASYDSVDYDSIMMLTEDLKIARRKALEEGNTALAYQLASKLDALSRTRIARGREGGRFIQASKKWIRTAEGAADVARGKIDDALDVINDTNPRAAENIRETADEMTDAIKNEIESNELWEALKREERRDELISEVKKTLDRIAKEKNVNVSDELLTRVSNDILEGAHAEDIANSLAMFEEYGFIGISDDTLIQVEKIFNDAEKFGINSKQRVNMENEAYRLLANEIYKTGGSTLEKVDAWRYLSMLANGKTHARNVTSTAVFSEVVNRFSNALAAGIESVADKGYKGVKKLVKGAEFDGKGIKRTKAWINPASETDRNLLSRAYKDSSEGSYRALRGQKYIETVSQGIEENKQIFNPNTKGGKALNWLSEKNSNALTKEDFFFKQNKYATSLSGYLKANGVDSSVFDAEKQLKDLMSKTDLTDAETELVKKLKNDIKVLDEAREYAVKEAQYATFNTRSESISDFSKFVRGLRESNKTSKRIVGNMIEGLVPFKNTPKNVLTTMVDYSPVGVFRGAWNLLTHATPNNVSDIISDISKGLTGTGMLWLGAKLAESGVLTASLNDKTQKSDKAEGKNEYAINIGGKSFTIDFLTPSAVPLFVGAELYNMNEARNKRIAKEEAEGNVSDKLINMSAEDINNLLESTMNIASPVLETSMLSSANDYLTNLRYSKTDMEALGTAVLDPTLSYAGQMIPTIGGQLARTTDNTRKSTRTNSSGLLGVLERAGRKNYNKLPTSGLPGLNKVNSDYVDMWGRTQNNIDTDNVLARAGYQFGSPFNIGNLNTEDYQAELDRLYDATSDTGVLNTDFENTIDSERLTNDEYFKAQTVAGQNKQDFIKAALNNESYKELADRPELQAEVMKDLIQLANDLGTKEVRPNKSITHSAFSTYDGSNIDEVIEKSIETNTKNLKDNEIKEMGYTANDVTREMYDSGNTEGMKDYAYAENIAKGYGNKKLTEKQWKIYNAKGEIALRDELKYDQKAKEYGTNDNANFRKAVDEGTVDQYLKIKDTLDSIVVGKDEYGEDKTLGYSDKTVEIYNERKAEGLKTYAKLKESATNSEGNVDIASAFNSVEKSGLSKSDQGYYMTKLINSKETSKVGKMVSQAKKTNDYSQIYDYYYYMVKADKDGNGKLKIKEELVPYLKKTNLSNKQKNNIVRLYQNEGTKKTYF